MATNHVYCSYQEVIDLHTEGNHVTVIGVHTPTGDTPRRMFKGLFDQFKQYRYNGCSIKLVPAARLPVDPLNVSVDPGQVLGTAVDPRDALNPLMFHGCHGDDMGTILNKLYGTENVIGDSTDGLDAPSSGALLPQAFRDVLERLYYKALTDNTWKKAGAQRGFMKSGLRPLVYSLAANRQIMPGTKGPVFTLGENGEIIQNLGDPMDSWQLEDESLGMPVNKSTLQLMTPRLTGLGWIDTKNVLTTSQDLQVDTLTDAFVAQENYTELPKIFMGVILLPPAYGVEQYFRMIINHSFTFRKFRGISFKPEMPNVPSYFNANEDLFDPEKYDGESEPSPEPEPEPDPPAPEYVNTAILSGTSFYSGSGYSKVTLQYNGVQTVLDSDTTLLSGTLITEEGGVPVYTPIRFNAGEYCFFVDEGDRVLIYSRSGSFPLADNGIYYQTRSVSYQLYGLFFQGTSIEWISGTGGIAPGGTHIWDEVRLPS